MKTGRIAVRVSAVDTITPRVKRFTLTAVDGARLPAYSAGSHIVVHMASGNASWRNSYSLIGTPGETGFYQIAVRREDPGRSKGGSIFLHECVREGYVVEIEPPANFFAPARLARKHVLIAGGIGITPFLAYLAALKATGADYEIHYAFQDRGHAAFVDEICAGHGSRARFYISSEGERLRTETILADQPLGSHVYVCGPHSLIDAVESCARAAGWPDRHVHSEEFTPAPAEHSAPFSAVVPSVGARAWVESDQTLLEALEGAGFPIASSCRVGRCGTCVMVVVDGEPEHRDRCLTEEERRDGRILACVSRARGESLHLEVAPA